MVIHYLTPEDSGPAYIRMHFPQTPGEGVFTLLATERDAPPPGLGTPTVLFACPGSPKRITQPIDITMPLSLSHQRMPHKSPALSVRDHCRGFTSKLPARNETCKKSAPDGNQTHTALETPCATEGAVHEKRRHARTHARTHERSRRRRLGLVRCACTGAVSSCRCRVPSHEGHRSRRRWRRRRRRRRRCS